MTQAFIRVNLRVLREILRLPSDVEITGILDDKADGSCALLLRGNLPAEGELLAVLDYEHTTILKFRGFEKVAQPTKALS